MKFLPTKLAGAYLIELNPFQDHRGLFSRVYCKKEFEKIGHRKEFVQTNFSFSHKKGIIRGLHYQNPPSQEIKLIQCLKGRVFDVIVDLRQHSPTFLHWFSFELSESNCTLMYVPEGFAHGFQALTDDCLLFYHNSAFYNQQAEGRVHYSDPLIQIRWPLPVSDISEKDGQSPLLDREFKGLIIE